MRISHIAAVLITATVGTLSVLPTVLGASPAVAPLFSAHSAHLRNILLRPSGTVDAPSSGIPAAGSGKAYDLLKLSDNAILAQLRPVIAAAVIVVLIAGWSIEREHEISGCRSCANGTGRVRGSARMTIATTLDRIPTVVPTELARGRGGGGPAPKRIVVAYGFWIFILSDMVMFSALFAAYAVLSGNTAGGPTAPELFNLRNVFIETMCLLLSSYTCGIGVLSAERGQPTLFLVFAIFTFAFGAAFLFIEATHGVHVASGLVALVYLVAQVFLKGLRPAVLRRLLCWSLFWHTLDIVWVGVFTLVYLMGGH
jgi:cytochrome o ubiquinol oxidase subunit 3